MSIKYQVVIIYIIGFLIYNSEVQAQKLGIYRIDAGGEVSTGFLIKKDNETVVITTLHGVLSSPSIQMSATGNKNFINCLKVKRINRELDLALLEVCDKKNSPNLLALSTSNKPKYKKVRMIGYPNGARDIVQSKIIEIRSKTIRKYKSLIPASLAKELIDFSIPALNTNVISIEGLMAGGYSGSPILDINNNVIGVADGSFPGGISWAIPFNSNIKWEEFKRENEKKSIDFFSSFKGNYYKKSYFGILESNGGTLQWQKFKRATDLTWSKANSYVIKMNKNKMMGYTNWRLPSAIELKELRGFIQNNPGIYNDVDKLYRTNDIDIKPIVINLGKAKTTSLLDDSEFAVSVQRSKDKSLAVRLVRTLPKNKRR